MIEERRRKVSNAVAFAKGTNLTPSSSKPRPTSSSPTTFDHKKLQQQHKGKENQDMEAAEAYFHESEELRVNTSRSSKSTSSVKPNLRLSHVTMLGEQEPYFKDEHGSSDDTFQAKGSKDRVDKTPKHKKRSLFDCKTCAIATILFAIFLGGIVGVILGMTLNKGGSTSTSSSAEAENATSTAETMAPTGDVPSNPSSESQCTVKTQQVFPKMTTMTLYLGVNSNRTLDEIEYVADVVKKSYGMVSSGEESVCDPHCREIIEATIISSILVPSTPGNNEDAENDLDCPQTMKLVLGVVGTYVGCEDDFPGLFGVPSGGENAIDEGKRRSLGESQLPPSFIRRRSQEQQAMCACEDTAIGVDTTSSAEIEQTHQEHLIKLNNPMLSVVSGVCSVQVIQDSSGGALIGGIYVAPP
jgi:flagellar basal body-associated protein FliL